MPSSSTTSALAPYDSSSFTTWLPSKVGRWLRQPVKKSTRASLHGYTNLVGALGHRNMQWGSERRRRRARRVGRVRQQQRHHRRVRVVGRLPQRRSAWSYVPRHMLNPPPAAEARRRKALKAPHYLPVSHAAAESLLPGSSDFIPSPVRTHARPGVALDWAHLTPHQAPRLATAGALPSAGRPSQPPTLVAQLPCPCPQTRLRAET